MDPNTAEQIHTDAHNTSDPGPTSENSPIKEALNNTAPELGQEINAVTCAQAANAPIDPPPEKPASPPGSVDLELYSNIGSDLVQDDATYKKESDSLENTIGSLFNESYLGNHE